MNVLQIESADNLVEYFGQVVGSVNYVALARGDTGDSFDEQCAAYVELSSRSSVLPALRLSGSEYGTRRIKFV